MDRGAGGSFIVSVPLGLLSRRKVTKPVIRFLGSIRKLGPNSRKNLQTVDQIARYESNN